MTIMGSERKGFTANKEPSAPLLLPIQPYGQISLNLITLTRRKPLPSLSRLQVLLL